ncbi:MAG: hypothetical protein M0R80_27245 [Proteobacteria bacterium]|jgi:hypothetical protein|nr:hypothetical protein [Pseudomonadota bacterium]
MPRLLETLEILNAEHDNIATSVKKNGGYIWNQTLYGGVGDWERFTGSNGEKPDVTYTYTDGYLTRKVSVFADRTETTDYVWTNGLLQSKETTIT